MDTTIRNAVEAEIRAAFRGVTLGEGVSLRQAQLIDNGGHMSPEPSKNYEITNDWSRVPFDELERDCVAHLDLLGFRYYIPALMLSLIDHYDSASMRVIGTLSALYPKRNDGWEYHMHQYSLFTAAQKAAIARFLAKLPQLVELDLNDQTIVERALRNYWNEYLDSAHKRKS